MKDVQNLIKAGDVANRSPLIALAKMNPALSTLAQNPFPVLIEPLPKAEAIRANPTRSQYAIARATVHQKTIWASP